MTKPRLPTDLPASRQLGVIEFATGSLGQTSRRLAEELPVAFEYNGFGYAVMMASPRDLEDFAVGFTLSEGLVTRVSDIVQIAHAKVDEGMIVRITLAPDAAAPLQERLRLRLVEGSCGLCGLENLEEVMRPLAPITTCPAIDAAAISRALGRLRDYQPLSQATGAMHGAAFCSASGDIVAIREDIGRHNALDKVIGHLRRNSIDPAIGFILLTARCSYELVEKTVRAGCPALVTISAPSDLAASRAVEAGLTLVALARSDSALVLNDPHRRFG